MKKIIIKIILLLFILVIIDRVFTYFFTRVIFSKTMSGESGGSVNYLLTQKKTANFFVMGSSRAKHHIDPALLTNAYQGNGYNAGINGTGGIIYNEMLLTLMLENKIKPALIILQADANQYFSVKEENITGELLPLYPFLQDDKVLADSIQQRISNTERFKLLFHSYRYNGKLLNVIYNYAKRGNISNNNGFEGLAGQIDTTVFHRKEDLNKKHNYSPAKLTALLNIINMCKVNGIKLAVVFPPAYRNTSFYPADYSALKTLIMQQRYVTVFDFSDVEKNPSLKQANAWKDAGHLNKQGSIIFSNMLNDSLALLR